MVWFRIRGPPEIHLYCFIRGWGGGGGYMELGGPIPCGGWGWGGIESSGHLAEGPPSPPNTISKMDFGGGPGSEPAMVNLKDLVKGSFVFPLYFLQEAIGREARRGIFEVFMVKKQ